MFVRVYANVINYCYDAHQVHTHRLASLNRFTTKSFSRDARKCPALGPDFRPRSARYTVSKTFFPSRPVSWATLYKLSWISCPDIPCSILSARIKSASFCCFVKLFTWGGMFSWTLNL